MRVDPKKTLFKLMTRLWYILFLIPFVSGTFAQDEIWMRPNHGQWHENVAYKIEVPGGNMYLEETGFTYDFSSNHEHYHHAHEGHNHTVTKHHVVKTKFLNASTPSFQEMLPSPFYENYFLGNDQRKWVKKSHAYQEVLYANLYSNIDLRIYQKKSTLKYDVIVKPGGNVNDFKVEYTGQDDLQLKNDELVIVTSFGNLIEKAPYAYQITNGIKQKIPCHYRLVNNRMSFEFPQGYDTSKILYIDPELAFSSFTGSTSDNWGMTACPDINGNLIGGGIVMGSGYPTSPGTFDDTFAGIVDVGITKFNADGSDIIYSTYIGGIGSETPHSIIVNEDNDLYIMGATSSTDFPVGGSPYQAENNLGGGAVIDGINFTAGADIFLIKLSEAGDAILGGTFMGGSGFDGISETGEVVYNYGDQLRGEVVVDESSNVYITSTSTSIDFPIVGGFDASLGGGKDAIAAKFNSNLTSLLWSSFVGGNGDESGNSIKVTSTGDILVVGGTTSNDLPNTGGNIHPAYQGGSVDGYLMKFIAPAYTAEATYLGTNDYDQAYLVDTDIDDNIYIYGQSSGPYQTDGDNYINPNSGQFIHKISNDLGTTVWSSVFGAGTGVAEISPTALLISECYEIYIAGWGGVLNESVGGAIGSTTEGFPTTADAYQDDTGGSNFYLAVFTQEMADLKYGTFMGDPSSTGDHVDGGTSRFDKNGTIYHAICAACASAGGVFPTTPGVFAPDKGASNCNMAVFQFDLSKIQAVLSTGAPIICIPDPVIFTNESLYGDNYLWDFGDGETSTEFEPTHFYEEPGTYTVRLVVSDDEGCYEPDTAYIEVIIEIFEGTAGTLTDTICPGTSVELFATGGDTYSWGPEDLLSDPSSANPIATIDEETTFTVTIESICGMTELEVTVYVFETDTDASPDTAICVGDQVVLNASGGDTYNWTPPEFLDDPTSPNPIASPPITTFFNVEITTADGCLVEDTVKVHVDLDVPNPILQDETTICKGDSIRVTAGGATDYLWYPDYRISDVTAYNPFLSPLVDTLYLVDFTNACGTVTDSVYVHVIEIEAEVSPDITICPGESTVLTASGGNYYKWYPSGYLSNPNAAVTTSKPLHDMTYTVFVSDDYGCKDSAIVNVYLFDPPPIEVSPAVYPIIGDTSTIWAIADGEILWTPDYNIECTICPTTVVFPETNTAYIATVTDSNGCTNSAQVPILFEPIIYVPNAFSPDGDSFNNSFKAIGHNIVKFQMQIFNRWGELIYTMNSIDEEWSGSYNGNLAPDDVYVWQIIYTDLNGKDFELTGHVVLLK